MLNSAISVNVPSIAAASRGGGHLQTDAHHGRYGRAGGPTGGGDNQACYCPISTRSTTLTVTSIMPTSSGVGGAAPACASGAIAIDPAQTCVATAVDTERIEELPVESRNYLKRSSPALPE
jgi:hypothetical protein